MKEKVVIIKIIPPIIIGTKVPREVKIELDKEESTLSTVLSKMHELCGIPLEMYDETLKRFVHVFWTRALIKNGIEMGRFGVDGLKLGKGSDSSVKGGDELVILLPTGGG